MRWAFAVTLVACVACSSKQAAPTTGSGGGTGGPGAGGCDGVRDKVAALYRAEAAARPGKQVGPTYVEDNTQMVVGECTGDPARVVPCVTAADTVAVVERCLAPLDDEGSEGDGLVR